MKHFLFSSLIFGFALFSLNTSIQAADEPTSFTLTKVRLLAIPGTEAELRDGRILGSLEGATTGMVLLAEVVETPARGEWLEVVVPHARPYRYIKFVAGAGTAVRLAEIEFYSSTGKLAGRHFGTHVPNDKADASAEKAFDGNAETYFEFPNDNSYAGLDLGG